MLQAAADALNSATHGWAGHDDYDHDRWRQTPFLNAEDCDDIGLGSGNR
ncbi:hypothetical protein RKE30_39360 [Streptomyces sp. Li-HN-5-11]|nr:hypothetical protein [Streptomyces sp. Li-HN-5-11]WNM35985.1 hypothetical protein RKE30_39360 [Streptomyces sp. Li-HN-5-11]